jgi:glycosyltransferase involved in cell wall biosynthesis
MVITSLSGSGAERVTLNLAEMFIQHGHIVDLFLLENTVQLTVSHSINIHFLTQNRRFYKWLGALGDRLMANKLIACIAKLNKTSPGSYDLFLSHLPAADKVVSLCRMPNAWYCIHTSYSGEISEFRRLKRGFRAFRKWRLYRSLYQDKNLVAVSLGVEGDLVKNLSIKPKNILTIYNPFQFDYLRKLASREINCFPGGDFIVHAGAFRPVKRHDLLLEAFALVKHDIKLVLLANECPELVGMVNRLGLEGKVLIFGHQDNPYPILKAAKLMVLCSDREGLPTVIVESLILGTPVVSTDCPSGPAEILTGDLEEWLVPTNNPIALAGKIDQALAAEINIRDSIIEKFSSDEAYTAYKNLIIKN